MTSTAHRIALLMALVVPAGHAAGQEPPRADAPARPVPTLPGAVTEPPEWLLKDAPFDVVKFFEAPPPDQNAAPLYLDAMLEFRDDVAACFPNDAETARRAQRGIARFNDWSEIFEALEEGPNSVPAARIDALLAGYEDGFRKLAKAQQRRACVFQTGIGPDAMLPHTLAARQVARIVQLRARRDLERGDLDRPIQDIATVLRLARDLRSRGFFQCQLQSSVVAEIGGRQIVPPLLAAPGLRPEHCDRLLRILREHEARVVDPMAEGLKAEYVMWRSAIRDLARQSDLSAADAQRQVEWLNTFYRDLAALTGLPYEARVGEEDVAVKALPKDQPANRRIAELIYSSIANIDEVFTRALAAHRGAICLVALRRWQLTANRPPTDLAAIVQAVGLAAVPIDPYDGKPLKLTTIEGMPVIYSVGKDGHDDRAVLDSSFNLVPGDLIFRIPTPPG